MSRRPPPAPAPAGSIPALLLGLAVVATPHALHLPPWITVLALVAGLWRYHVHRSAGRLPRTWLLAAITLATTAAVVLSYGELSGRDMGVGLLVSMTALKMLEMRSRRDAVLMIFLGYLLVVAELLYSQSIPAAAYMLASSWLLTALLVTVTRPTGDGSPLPQMRPAAALLVQAVPLALVLFVLFPRIPGPLWGAPDSGAAVTGLSDTMSPGSITELSLSGAVAFRAELDGALPAASERYWRGPVLARYDGRTWSHPPERNLDPPALQARGGRQISYTVSLEPHGQRWLLALEMATAAPPDSRLSAAAELLSRRDVVETRRYRVTSAPQYRLQPELSAEQRERFLALPPGSHPGARRLARRWQTEAAGAQGVVDRALAYFREQPFVYTLRPPALPGDPVDDFLFDTRQGFCEHYASAFTALMRAAGIPARVVTGYLGGEPNPHGDYLIVRQSDAHAWSEVWLAGRGWVRVDPTAAVSPARVELGLAGAVPAGDPVPFMAGRGMGWLQGLSLRWDAVNALWDRWVLAYGPELQRSLLRRWGLEGWLAKGGALLAGIGVALGLALGAVLWRGRPPSPDPVLAAYRRLGRKLGRVGLAPNPNEPPLAYRRRVAREAPALAGEVDRIMELYLGLRYGPPGQGGSLGELRRRVARLRPAR